MFAYPASSKWAEWTFVAVPEMVAMIVALMGLLACVFWDYRDAGESGREENGGFLAELPGVDKICSRLRN